MRLCLEEDRSSLALVVTAKMYNGARIENSSSQSAMLFHNVIIQVYVIFAAFGPITSTYLTKQCLHLAGHAIFSC
jgi:hypothetical protein